jgi:hypothetical protein
MSTAGRLRAQERPDLLGDVARRPLTGRDDRPHVEGPAELLHEVHVSVGRLVPDRDVAARLVGHVHLVPLLAQADERSPHADHVVVGVRAEDDDPPGLLAGPRPIPARRQAADPPRRPRLPGGPAGDRVLHRPEDLDVEVVGPAAGGEQILEPVLVVVLVGELEDRLLEPQRQPDHGLPREWLGPHQAHRLERTDEPRRLEPRQPRRRRPVEHEPRVGMLLEGACRHVAARRLLDRLVHDRRLVLAKGQQHDAAGIEDRAHAHRDRLAGHVPLAEEVGGGVGPGDAVQRDQSGAALGRAARLVEAHMAGPADAQDLQVDATGLADRLLVPRAGLHDPGPRQRAVGDVDLGGGDVQMVEEVLPHEAVVALQGIGLDRPVLVEVEGRHRRERHALLAVQPHEFGIDAHGRRARRQAEDGPLSGLGPGRHQVGDLAGHGLAGVGRLLVDGHGHPFHRRDVRQRAAIDRRCVDCRRTGCGLSGHGFTSCEKRVR